MDEESLGLFVLKSWESERGRENGPFQSSLHSKRRGGNGPFQSFGDDTKPPFENPQRRFLAIVPMSPVKKKKKRRVFS